MNTWRNLPGKIWVTIASLDPRLRGRSSAAAARLSPEESELFLAMARYDLAHSLAVAARLEDDPLLYKAGLLHDAGKLRSELDLFARWLYTAMELFMPQRLQRTGAAVEEEAVGEEVKERIYSLPRGWKRGLYVQLHHGEIAGELLSSAGSDEELVRLVGEHQDEPADEKAGRLREIDDSL
jgi:hypothetical protein